MNCKIVTLKCTALTVNVLCGIIAVLLVALNLYQLINMMDIDILYTIWLMNLILYSTLLFITSINCTGILCNALWLLWLHAFVMGILMIGQIILIILHPSNENIAISIITKSWDMELIEPQNMAFYEMQLKCCGKMGPNDYDNSVQTMPPTCFANLNRTDTEYLYTDGCITKLHEYLNNFKITQIIFDSSLLAIFGLNLGLTVYLGINIKHDRRRKRYR